MECRERGGQVGAQGVPEPQAHSRQKGEGIVRIDHIR